MSRWWRAYDDALNDPKVQGLPPKLFKFWFNLLCVASKNDGVIPPLEDLKAGLKARLDHTKTHLEALLQRGLVDEIDGHYEPHNWKKRQYKSDNSTPRVKAHREAKRNVSETPPEQNRTEQKIDDAEDARASPPLIRPEAYELADLIALDCKHDLKFVPPEWCGAAMRVETWLAAGWPREIILASVKGALAKKRGPPPNSINYFEKPIAEAVALAARPLPKVVIDSTAETVHVRQSDPARSLSQRAVSILNDGLWNEPSGGIGGSPAPVRLLSKG